MRTARGRRRNLVSSQTGSRTGLPRRVGRREDGEGREEREKGTRNSKRQQRQRQQQRVTIEIVVRLVHPATGASVVRNRFAWTSVGSQGSDESNTSKHLRRL